MVVELAMEFIGMKSKHVHQLQGEQHLRIHAAIQ